MTPRPPWECHDQRDKRKFKAWLNQQLDASYELTWDDIMARGTTGVPAARARKYARHLQRERVIGAARQLQRGRMSRAERDEALQALQQLTADDPELKDLALQAATHRRGRGREPGEPRPRDLSDDERAVRWDALAELDRAREIMMHHYGRYKGSDWTVLEVVAKRAGISPEALDSTRKNQNRRRRFAF